MASKSSQTTDERVAYFKNSAFVGSSISVGLENYVNYQNSLDERPATYIGSPVMLVRESYSFYNDKNSRSKYIPQYNGTAMQAKTAIKQSGVKRAFVQMGTNDIYNGVDTAFNNYVEYLNGIIEENPNIEIFIESATSVVANSSDNELNAKNINALNAKMQEYCQNQKNMYYIDISSKMNDSDGNLLKKYSSDGYVHLTNDAYKIWLEQIISYTDKMEIERAMAENAVDVAQSNGKKASIKKANDLVNALDDSSFKDNLVEKLSTIS
jgi:hypothetical protein